MTKATPTVSICIPAYNSALTLAETIESVLSQTYQDFEILLQDNASSDGTWRIMQDFSARDFRIRAERNETNLGMLGNWNKVASRAKGKYFLLLSADDCLLPDFLATCLSRFAERPHLLYVSTDHWLFDERHSRPRKIRVHEGEVRDHASLILLKNPFSINFTLIDRARMNTFIGADKLFRHYLTCDYDLHIRSALSGNSVYYVDARLGRYRLHSANLSKQTKRMTRQALLTLLSHKAELNSKARVAYRLTLLRFLLRAIIFPLRKVHFDSRLVKLAAGRMLESRT